MPSPTRSITSLLASLGVCAWLAVGCSEFRPRVDAGPACAGPPCDVAGALQCEGARQRICVDDSAGCLFWQAVDCPAGLRCGGEGICGADECPTDGAARCQGQGGLQVCERVSGPFLDWSSWQACPDGLMCQDGLCDLARCDSVGARGCADATHVQVCQSIAGRLQWADATPCGPDQRGADQRCRGAGNCGVDQCAAVGRSECVGKTRYRQCEASRDGFRRLGSVRTCPDGDRCGATGQCGHHQCSPQSPPSCVGEAAVVTCDAGPDGFWRPSDPILCPADQQCVDGACMGEGCPEAGATECTDNTHFRVCDEVISGLLQWSEPAACDGGVCLGYGCVPHECPGPLALRCFDTHSVQKCELQDTGQLLWGPPLDCAGVGAQCKGNGLCGKDQCPAPGVLQCVPDGGVQSCTVSLNGFLSWSAAAPCENGAACANGACGADACPVGATQCDGPKVVTCALGADSFALWGPPLNCSSGQSCVGEGLCASNVDMVVADTVASGAPTVTALDSGGFAVAFTTAQSGAFAVNLRRFGPTGSPQQSLVDLSGPLGIAPPLPSIAAAPFFGPAAVLVAWLDGGTGTVHVRLSASSGASLSALSTVAPSLALPSNPCPRLAPIAPGRVALAWLEGPVNVLQQHVGLAVGTYADADSGVVFEVEPSLDLGVGPAMGQELTGLALGPGLAGAWAVWTRWQSTDAVFVRPLDPQGLPTSAPLTLASVAANPSSPAMAFSAELGLLVVFEAGPDTQREVFGQWLTGDADLAGPPLALPPASPMPHTQPAATALQTGYLVGWAAGAGNDTHLWAGTIHSPAASVGTPFAIGLQTDQPEAGLSLVTLMGGNLVAVWRQGQGLNARIRARFFVPPSSSP